MRGNVTTPTAEQVFPPANRPLLSALIALTVSVAAMVPIVAADAPDNAAPPFSTGLEFLDPGSYQAIPLATPSFGGPLPEQAMVQPLPPAGHQGMQASCVGWAIAGARSILHARRSGTAPLPPDRFFSPAWIYNQIRLDKSSCSGFSFFVDGLNLLTKDGILELVKFPYYQDRCDAVPKPSQHQGAAAHRVAAWRRVNVLDETEIKTHLASGAPVLVGMMVDAAFGELAKSSVYQGNENGDPKSGHAMVAVGYDDTRGAFRLLNSWGTKWADDGYGWISYTAFRRMIREGYVLQEASIGADTPPYLEVEFVLFEERGVASRHVERTTEDHHCWALCEGEPTRTNYRMDLAAEGDTYLRNPELRCVQGPCHGWKEIRQVRLSPDGKLVTASWDVWTKPTTWRLSAEVVRKVETGRFVRRIEQGDTFTVSTPTGSPAPEMIGHWSNGSSFRLTAGKSTGHPDIRMVGIEVNGPETLFKYETN